MNCSRAVCSSRVSPTLRVEHELSSRRSTQDPKTQAPYTFQGDNLIIFPRPVTKHYDPRFPPRPLARVACLAYDEFTIHVYHTLYSPRRVILFSRPYIFLAFLCVFCGPIGKPSFWICPWFYASVPSSSVLTRVRFRPHPPLPPSPATYLCLQEKSYRD